MLGISLVLLCGLIASKAQAFDFGLGRVAGNNSKCYMSGSIRPLQTSSSRVGFLSLENRIRLNFDASDAQTCERYLKSYCQNNIIGRGDVPEKLTAYFRPSRNLASENDKKPTHVYIITENCKLILE
jgi:hypothetical protein